MDCFVIHYSEIGIKGKNRPFFEKKLIENIRKLTGLNSKKRYGRIITEYNPKKKSTLKKIPGIAYFSPAYESELNIDNIFEKAKLLAKDDFRIITKRSNKSFKYTSLEINKIIADKLVKEGFKANVKKPKRKIFIEICEKNAYIYKEKIKGLGGLPVGTTGKLIALISGGIDSPVAAFYMIKRGCKVSVLHFYNQSSNPQKIFDLAKKLSEYQGKTKIYIVPFKEIQKQIIINCPAKYRMILYRRAMFKIGNEIIKKLKIKGFVTGDNIGQVASQTLENLKCIWDAAKENVYAPLIGFDKEEIIHVAKKIGTYEISIQPYADCCSFLVAKHPETKANLDEIKKIEKNIKYSFEVEEYEI